MPQLVFARMRASAGACFRLRTTRHTCAHASPFCRYKQLITWARALKCQEGERERNPRRKGGGKGERKRERKDSTKESKG
eukprot:6207990-Pleurochrysis_carterae.AAC.3